MQARFLAFPLVFGHFFVRTRVLTHCGKLDALVWQGVAMSPCRFHAEFEFDFRGDGDYHSKRVNFA